MPVCVCLPTCPFFQNQMKDMPATAGALKKVYCEGDNSQCARFMIFQALGKEKTPSDLFPNDVMRAQEFIARNKKGDKTK